MRRISLKIQGMSCAACLDMDERFCIPDQEAGKIIQALCKIKSGPDLQKMEKTQRNIYLKKLKDEYNLSIRQIASLTGINRGIIYRA
jgi:copper chaperone CopZ